MFEVLLILKSAEEACSFQGKIAGKKLFPSELANVSSLDMLPHTRPQEWNTVIYRQVAEDHLEVQNCISNRSEAYVVAS